MLLLHEDPLVFDANCDAGTELLGIANRELLVGMDFDPREQCLRKIAAATMVCWFLVRLSVGR